MAVGVVGRWYLGPLLCGWRCCCRWSWWRLCVDGSQAWYFEGGTAHGFTLSAPMHYCWYNVIENASRRASCALHALLRSLAVLWLTFYYFFKPLRLFRSQIIQGKKESSGRIHRVRLESCILMEQTIEQPHTWKVVYERKPLDRTHELNT